MAEPRNARLIDAQFIGDATRLMSFQLEEARPLGFIGGQYVIVNTGMPLPGGKIAKRAYSLLSADTDQHRFQIAVKRIGTGPGSNFMHTLSVGAELTFSGPWGKFFPAEGEPDPPTLVIATDTGVTAALGLVRSARAASALATMRFIWFVESPDYFLPELMVSDLASDTDEVIVVTGPPVDHPERVPTALTVIRELCGETMPQRAFLSGDGNILFPLCEELKVMGVSESAIRMECFFNNPIRKAP
jgi:ferredoxin-NADP reductase